MISIITFVIWCKLINQCISCLNLGNIARGGASTKIAEKHSQIIRRIISISVSPFVSLISPKNFVGLRLSSVRWNLSNSLNMWLKWLLEIIPIERLHAYAKIKPSVEHFTPYTINNWNFTSFYNDEYDKCKI